MLMEAGRQAMTLSVVAMGSVLVKSVVTNSYDVCVELAVTVVRKVTPRPRLADAGRAPAAAAADAHASPSSDDSISGRRRDATAFAADGIALVSSLQDPQKTWSWSYWVLLSCT